MAQNHVLSNGSCCVGQSENLNCSSESPWNEDAKIGIGLISSSNTSQENQQNDFLKQPWIHWCVVNCSSLTALSMIHFGWFYKVLQRLEVLIFTNY